MDENERVRPDPGDEGTAAVLYGMLTSFSEALGQFDQRLAAIEGAVRDGPPDLLGRTERLEAAMDRLVAAVDGRQAGLDVLLDTVRSVAGRVESMGARIELAREGVDAVVQSAEWFPGAVESFRSLESTVAERSATLDAEAVADLGALVRRLGEAFEERSAALAAELEELRGLVARQAELLEHHDAALSSSVGALRALLQSHVDDTAHSLGRRASEAGRRLASDLGFRGRPKPPPVPGAPGR